MRISVSGTDFWIWTVIQIVTKIELIGPWAMPYPSKKFRQNPFTTFSVIDGQTDKQTEVKTSPPSAEVIINGLSSS